MAVSVLKAMGAIDCREILRTIQAPTLILHKTGDRVCSVGAARYMAGEIPEAACLEFPGEGHSISMAGNERILGEIEHFFTGVRRTPEPDRVLATVLFTDLVDSTGHAARLGDRAWRQLLERHHTTVRQELERYGGREGKTLGDGFLPRSSVPAGPSPPPAPCGTASAGSAWNCGPGSTGECEMMGDDVAGVAVHTAARVAALARPGEVLVSSTVKDLVAGSGLQLIDRGSHDLKGVPGPWRLFTVLTVWRTVRASIWLSGW